MADDGTLGEQKRLAAKAGVSPVGNSGLDLMYAGALKDAGLTAGGAGLDGARVQQLAQERAVNTPVATSITPATGAAAGGTATVIRGSGFTGVTAVHFGGTAGTSFSVVNDTQINVTTPAKAAGTYDVTFIKPGYQGIIPNGFIYT